MHGRRSSEDAFKTSWVSQPMVRSATVSALVALLAIGLWWSVGEAKDHRRMELLREELLTLEGGPAPFPFEPVLNERVILRPLAIGGASSSDIGEFEDALWSLHSQILEYVGRRVGLSEFGIESVLAQAEADHETVARAYYDEFMEGFSERREIGGGLSGFSFEYSAAANDFSRLLGEKLCALTSLAFGVVSSASALQWVAGLPSLCAVAMSDVLAPVTAQLQAEGLLLDLVMGREILSNHLHEAITELGTARAEFDETIELAYSRDVFRIFRSTGHLDLSAHPVVTAGFDLGVAFTLTFDPERKELLVTLPQPEILSVEPHPVVTRMQHGFFVSIDEPKLNAALRTLERRASQAAVDSGLLDEAVENARLVIRQILAPVALSPFGTYSVRVEVVDGDASR